MLSITSVSAAVSVDIFCRVIDNFGDAGVCWRLARQLGDEYGAKVRLIIDDVAPLQLLEPSFDRSKGTTRFSNISVVAWDIVGSEWTADWVIEAFACNPPARYIDAMATRAVKPFWINLEYLSAESWVDGVHGLPSPHSKLPLTKYFFVPGFTEKSGGLIMEAAVRERAELMTPTPKPTKSRVRNGVSIFSFTYPAAPVALLANAFVAAGMLPRVAIAAPLLSSESGWQKVAHVPQTDFDRLLAQHDVLLVRGEDSFVRAQLAGKPMLWDIYRTEDNAHCAKLDAWLDLYCAQMRQPLRDAYINASRQFVDYLGQQPDLVTFRLFAKNFEALCQHAVTWRESLCSHRDLLSRLVEFHRKLELERALNSGRDATLALKTR